MNMNVDISEYEAMDMSIFIPQKARLESRPHRAGVGSPLRTPLGSHEQKKGEPKTHKQTKHKSFMKKIFP
jgi:hypothetical protein